MKLNSVFAWEETMELLSHKKKIYCAGPLFNDKEKEEMAEIAAALEDAGFDVFLPHRDGFEFSNLEARLLNKGVNDEDVRSLISKAIFYLDVYHVLSSWGLVLNLNGRVPDEGAVVEAGIAWSSNKHVVIYKNDVRSLISGFDNPLVIGLSDFIVASSIHNIPNIFHDMRNRQLDENINEIDSTRLNHVFSVGRSLSAMIRDIELGDNLCIEVYKLLGGNDEQDF